MAKKVRLIYIEVKERGTQDAMLDTVNKMQGLIVTRYEESPDWVIHGVSVFPIYAGDDGGKTYMMVSMTRDI